MKIGFATDTNILRKNKLSECQKILDVTDIYTEYIEALNKIGSEYKLIYYMPEIVVDELLMQKEILFNQTYKSFEDKYKENSYGLLGKVPKNNIKVILAQEKEEYKEKYKLIKLEYTAELTKILFENFENTDFYIDKVEKENDNFNIYCSFRTLKYQLDIDVNIENKKYIIGNIKIIVTGKKDKYSYVSSEVSKVDFDLGVIDILKGFSIGLGDLAVNMSKIVKENVINTESFNSLKQVQKVLEKQNEERNKMLYSISNPLKDVKIPTIADIYKTNNKIW